MRVKCVFQYFSTIYIMVEDKKKKSNAHRARGFAFRAWFEKCEPVGWCDLTSYGC